MANDLEKAVELKRLIDSAHLYLPVAGSCLSLEEEYIKVHDDVIDSDTENAGTFRRREFKKDVYKKRMDKPWDSGSGFEIESETTATVDDKSRSEAGDGPADAEDTSDDGSEDYESEDYESEDDESEEERAPKTKEVQAIKRIQQTLGRLYTMREFAWSFDKLEEEGLTVQGTSFAKMTDITREDVERWYNSANNSSFGNVAAQQTQQDPRVRLSRELTATQFAVEPKTLDRIAKIWGDHLTPKSVTVQPYKLVVYGPGDHFTWHKDTPEEKLCGTFLISIFQDCKPKNVFEIFQNGVPKTWSHEKNEWCAFYPDVPHRVRALTSGYRAMLSFKVFAHDSDYTRDKTSTSERLMDEIMEGIKKVKSIGILLKHHYGYNSKSIYGCDEILLKHLKSRNLDVDLKPVLIRLQGDGPDCDSYTDISVKSSVYYLTDDALDVVRQKLRGPYSRPAKRQKTSQKENLVFIDGVRLNKSGLWVSHIEEAAEKMGNESRSHSEDSVYVRYAAVIKASDAE